MTDDPPSIYTVEELIEELQQLPPESPVMISVVKYPDEFAMRHDKSTGTMRWDTGSDTEQHPLEQGDIQLMDGITYLSVELDDFDEARAAG